MRRWCDWWFHNFAQRQGETETIWSLQTQSEFLRTVDGGRRRGSCDKRSASVKVGRGDGVNCKNQSEAALRLSPECLLWSSGSHRSETYVGLWSSGSANKSLEANCHYRCQSGRVIPIFFLFFEMISFTATHSPWSRMKYSWEHGEDNNVKAWWILLSLGRPAWISLFHSPNCPRHLSQIGDSVSQMYPTVGTRDGWSQALRLSERELNWSKSGRQSTVRRGGGSVYWACGSSDHQLRNAGSQMFLLRVTLWHRSKC